MLTKKSNLVKAILKNRTQKKAKRKPSGWVMFTKCSFDAAGNKLDYYRGRDCIEKLYKKLKEHATKITNYKEKEMILLTHEENKSYEGQEVCHICKEEFCTNENNENEFKVKKKKVRDHCHHTGKFRGAAHNICNFKYKVSKIFQ